MSTGKTPQMPKDQNGLRRRDLLLSGTAIVAAAALGATKSKAKATETQSPQPTPVIPPAGKPNILVIFGDDIGQSNISAYSFGVMGYRTPNIDRLANEGMKFTDYYAEQSKIALLPGKTELFDLSKDPGEQNNVADEFPEIAADLEARLLVYAKEKKPSEWIKAQPTFLGAQGKTIFDPDFDIDDGGLPHEKPVLPPS